MRTFLLILTWPAFAAEHKLQPTLETVCWGYYDAAARPVLRIRSGDTVESLVAEMLKPMMKAWLDANLPAIVEHIVEREVKKLTK